MEVLVVDDEVRIATLLVRIANDSGHQASMITNMNDFVECFDSSDPDIIILDVFMPEMDGFDVLRFLKERQCKSKIIVISGDFEFCSMASQMADVMELNIIGGIHKPFRTQEVRELLEDLNNVNIKNPLTRNTHAQRTD